MLSWFLCLNPWNMNRCSFRNVMQPLSQLGDSFLVLPALRRWMRRHCLWFHSKVRPELRGTEIQAIPSLSKKKRLRTVTLWDKCVVLRAKLLTEDKKSNDPHNVDAPNFHYTFHSLELRCDEVEAVVQVAFSRHLLQVGVAVLILVHKVVRHQKSCRTAKAKTQAGG